MRLIHCCLAGVLSLLSFASFAEELVQGTLKNGMRYYLYSDPFEENSTVALAVKRPQEQAFLSLPDPFASKEQGQIFPYWSTESTFHYGYFEGNTKYAVFSGIDAMGAGLVGLDYIAGCLQSKIFPQKMVDKFRKDYQKELEEFDADEEDEREVGKFVFGDIASYEADLFAKSDEEIKALCHAFFEPSRLAIIATGSFNLVEMEKELEHLFGDIQGDGLFMDVFQPERPVAITIKQRGILDRFFDEEYGRGRKNKQKVNLCFYRFAPSFRNYVLNDLFFFTQFDPDLFFCPNGEGEFEAEYFFPFVEKEPSFSIDERTFDQAKEELRKRYQESDLSIAERCKNHFTSGIEGDLELNNQQLLSELESIQLEDLAAFISETVQNVPISREFNLF